MNTKHAQPVYLTAFFLAVVLLFGCGSGASPPSNTPCVLPAGMTAVLVAPAPGSVNNNTVPPQIIFATTAAIPTSWAGVLYFPGSMGSGIARFLTTIQQTTAPTTTPPAFQLPSFSNPIYYATNFQGNPLPLGTLITVAIYDTSANCSPGVTIGTFTTSP